ncbi:histone deacetylase 1-like [Hordeum vulgare subsp. vulgare]|uniref:histone deacetylase 1-like n=1 Tax=Hordeum vulgare subsp. vulgare TaxID=112509 RepID=UPI001D1A4B15|nr:histone deacetylase 1-like [Hordeum vulgare subsp. vulgare]
MDMGTNSLPSPSCADGRKRRVCYYYDADISNVDYGEGHAMVPRRVAMTHALIASYGLLNDMTRLRIRPARPEELLAFHDQKYVHLLGDLTPAGYTNDVALRRAAKEHGLGPVRRPDGSYPNDNPVIDGLLGYCQGYAGGSLAAARALCGGDHDVAINWSGGMHHACRGQASGFCYVNDIVLAIKQLLARFRRVLYVDIDAHHGDGVEEAFADSDQVMTLSFHQYAGGFFPGTGSVDDVGKGAGLYHALNVPLKAGMDDQGYHELFKPIVGRAMQVFQPEAVVLQCGADSLSGDRLAGLDLSVGGHAECVRYLRGFDAPLLLLGGGGYTINHVASCWCYETAVAVGREEIPNEIPHHPYEHYYRGQGYMLQYRTKARRSPRDGDKKEADAIRVKALEHLSAIRFIPTTAGAVDGPTVGANYRRFLTKDAKGWLIKHGWDRKDTVGLRKRDGE